MSNTNIDYMFLQPQITVTKTSNMHIKLFSLLVKVTVIVPSQPRLSMTSELALNRDFMLTRRNSKPRLHLCLTEQ